MMQLRHAVAHRTSAASSRGVKRKRPLPCSTKSQVRTSVELEVAYEPFLLKLPYYHKKMKLVLDIFCFYKLYIFYMTMDRYICLNQDHFITKLNNYFITKFN